MAVSSPAGMFLLVEEFPMPGDKQTSRRAQGGLRNGAKTISKRVECRQQEKRAGTPSTADYPEAENLFDLIFLGD
jgi:hypothetical protein